MWILKIDPCDLTDFIRLEYRHNTNGIEYAILSHTWGDEEVTFQELRHGQGQDKEGYQKVVKACSQALEDGFQYAWVDTCCINKESSAELSEAINSMWQWYRDAAVCYALLEDVDSKTWVDPYADELQPDEIKQFKEARWFTRGWTLQELLAPERVLFYDTNWTYIGDKNVWEQDIWEQTGIDPLALQQPGSLSHFVTARKMSWAAGRSTTRVEDRAYSLLGIFGINMPLLYGEGSKAFVRLQEEIVRTTTDHSVFAWEPDSDMQKTADMIFAPSPDQFWRGKSMVRWLGGVVDHPVRITNRGVTFDQLLFVEIGAVPPRCPELPSYKMILEDLLHFA